jgi:hypothetical protein
MNSDQVREYRKLMASFKKTATIKECFYHKPYECKGDIKQSHSIQRNGRLSIIEGDVNGNQSIYTFTSNIPSDDHLISDLKPIGKKEASTFFGFCDYHDTTLFNPIENFPFDNSEKHLFLHSYRSFAHSYHRKKEDYKIYNDPSSDFIKAMPKSWIQTMKEGVNMAVNDSEKRKILLDTYIESEIYDELDYVVYEKNGLYPFAVSSQFSPRVSYKNKPMNNHIDPNIPFSQPIITLLPDKNTTLAIIAAFPDDEPAINLLNELSELAPLKLEKAITSLIMANCENTFFSPAFWNSLSPKEKRKFLDEFSMHTPDNTKYHSRFFHSAFNFFDTRFENSRLTK